MSDFLIKAAPTQAQAPNGTGNTNALSQSDAATRADEGTKAGKESGTESPFAAVLKSRMDKKPAAADESDGASSSAAATQAGPQDGAVAVDLSSLLPFLVGQQTGAGKVEAAPVSTAKSDANQNPLVGLQASIEEEPTQGLASLPAVSAASLPAATQPAAASNALPSALAAAVNAASRKQDTGAKEEAFASAAPARSDETGRTPGKIAQDAAISADANLRSGEKNTPESPANDFHALLERAATMTPAATNQTNGSSSGPSLRIDTPMGQTGWHDEVGQKLTWMVGNNRQQADLVLNPPQLGRIEVSLTMNGDQATAIFTSSNQAVREALENSLHRLREVLADAGVSLGQTQVGSESPNQPSRKNEPDLGRNEGIGYASTVPLPAVATTARTSAGRSMIDIFA
jgi:flagellar hook-length control protein FliK